MSNIDKSSLAKTRELATLMVERISMNPVSCKLLNEAWKKEFPDEVAIADRMLALLDELEAKDKLIAEQVEIIAKQKKWIKDVEATMIAAADRAEAAEKQIAELTGKPAPVVPALLWKMDSWRGAPCNGVEWAKGYQAGWNKYHQWLSERRAAVLQGAEKTEPLHAVKASPLLNSSVKGIELQHADFQAKAAGNSPMIPDGWVLVPVHPTMEMLDEFDSIIDYGAEDSKEAWSRLIAAAPQQEVKS